MVRYHLLVVLLLISAISLKAQQIRDVEFNLVSNIIQVNYKVANLDKYKVLHVDLYVSQDGGKSYEGPLKAVTGDVGNVEQEGNKVISWNVFEEYAALKGNIVFDVRATVTRKPIPPVYFLSLNGTATPTAGLSFGRISRWGWYMSFKTNASFETGSYQIKDNMILDFDRPAYYVFTDDISTTRAGITGGVIRRINNSMYLYAGIGYGQRILLWKAEEYNYNDHEKTNTIFAEHPGGTYKNFEADAGIMIRFGNFNLNFGTSSIGFNFFEPHLGVGYFFDF